MSPGSKKMLHPSDGVASPQFYFPHGKVFRRPVTGHQERAASTGAAFPQKEAALLLLRASHWGRE
jgi:hypothetical protein